MAPSDSQIFKLTAAIDEARNDLSAALAELNAITRKVEIKRAVYEALANIDPRRVADRPPAQSATSSKISTVPLISTSAPRTEGARGKAPGTLSNQWRSIMASFVFDGNMAATPEAWRRAAVQAGFAEIDTKAVRDWLRRAAKSEQRFIQQTVNGFRVSELAVEKFGLRNWTKNQSAPSSEEADILLSDQSAPSTGNSAEAGTLTEKGD
jgi:hypothetical protein